MVDGPALTKFYSSIAFKLQTVWKIMISCLFLPQNSTWIICHVTHLPTMHSTDFPRAKKSSSNKFWVFEISNNIQTVVILIKKRKEKGIEQGS